MSGWGARRTNSPWAVLDDERWNRASAPAPGARNGDQSGDQHRRACRGGDPQAARDGGTHPLVHVGEGSGGNGRGADGRRDVLAAGDDDDVIEYDVPDDERPRNPKSASDANSVARLPPRFDAAPRGPGQHTTDYRTPGNSQPPLQPDLWARLQADSKYPPGPLDGRR